MSILAVDDNNFENEVINSDTPVLVDFWAQWCGPCKSLMPVIEELASEIGDKVKVVKIDIEEAPEAPTKYGVRGVPTLMIFKDGKVVDTRVGGLPKAQLSNWINQNI